MPSRHGFTVPSDNAPAPAAVSDPGASPPAARSRIGPLLARAGLVALWTYATIVFLYQERLAGLGFGVATSIVVWGAGALLILLTASRLEARGVVSHARMAEIGALTLSLQAALLAADIGYSMVANAKRTRADRAIDEALRVSDAHVWHGELFPRSYFPTDRNFSLFKPNVRLAARTYGEYYSPPMLRSRTLTDSLLEIRQVTYTIGPHGFREQEPLGGTRIFALGDSFVLGYATDEGKTWTDLLGAALREPVYNLGVSATGPGPQLQLLRYMLESAPDSMRIERLLWMIFEGNDLENSYAELHPRTGNDRHRMAALLEGTVVQAAASLPSRLKYESIAWRLFDGEFRLSRRRPGRLGGMYEIDGVELALPLYRSQRWGYRIFHPGDVEAATATRDYVLNHPNRPLLDRTFREMRELSRQKGFEVTVIVAPSDARVYGADFDRFPALSERPHFIDYVVQLAEAQGFRVVNLLPLLQPVAQRELLYYRDDHHWNERGNAVVADLIKRTLFSERSVDHSP